MKNGNLYKLAALIMGLILVSTISFAQEKDKKVIEKKKTMMITMTVDEDGETTKVDTIVFGAPDIDIDEIMEDIDIQMDISKEKMKEIHVEVLAEMDELKKSFHFEFEDEKEELKEAMAELQEELEKLDLEEEAQQRIQQAMEKLEEAGTYTRRHVEKFMIDDDHNVFIGEDGNIEVIVNEDGDEVQTEVIWVDEDGKVSKGGEKELKVWVESDGDGSHKKKIIIKSDGEITEDENVFIVKEGDHSSKKVIVMEMEGADMAMLSATQEKDIEKAIEAGLPIDKDNMMKEMNISIEVKNDEAPIIKLKTDAEGKMKATAYDKYFKKVKKLKVSEEDGESILHLNTDELEEDGVHYIFFEQGGKTDLMRIQR